MSMLETLIRWDVNALILINSQATNPFFDYFFPLITDLHKTSWFLLTVAGIFFYFFVRNYGSKRGLCLFLFMILNLSATDFTGNAFIKKTVHRSRPADAGINPLNVRSSFGGYSFISNHAANTMAFANYCGYFLPQTRIVTLLAALLVSYSRIYNGVHYPGDVLGGLVWGIFTSLVFIRLARKLILNKSDT